MPCRLPTWQCIENLIGPEANLRYIDLYGADLKQTNLTGANLGFATLSRANLSGLDLVNIDLTNAYIDFADLRNSYLVGNLTGAVLYNLSNAELVRQL